MNGKPTPGGPSSTVRPFCLTSLYDSAEIAGPVVHFGVLTQHIVVLNTLQASLDLLEKRSGNYSDRPTFTMMSELYVDSRLQAIS